MARTDSIDCLPGNPVAGEEMCHPMVRRRRITIPTDSLEGEGQHQPRSGGPGRRGCRPP